MDWMIEVDRLVKRFGPITAVDDVTFNVGKGEVLGFLGPNGAGKSTTMKMITGYLTPTGGAVRVCGRDVVKAPIVAKSQIGYLPEGAPAYPDMTPISFLNFIADVRGLRGAQREERLKYVIDNVHLEPVLEQPIETLSKGFNRRVGLAQAILHDPPVLILDEPTDGLDPNQKFEVRTLIQEMGRDKAIIISTHILEEVDAVCTRAMIIANGRVVADGSPGELEARSNFYNAVRLTAAGDGIAASLQSLAGVRQVETTGPSSYRVYPIDGRPIIGEISEHARLQGWSVDELTLEPARLDDVFRNITIGDGGGGEGEAADTTEAA